MIRRAFADLREPRTYTRILYLLLALPLGVTEFAILVTGLSFGFGTAITLIGVPVLLFMVYAWRWMAQLERRVIGALVGTQIADPYRVGPAGESRWQGLRRRLADPATWKDLVFLVLQLPAGIIAFTLATVVLAATVALIGAPAYYSTGGGLDVGFTTIDTLGEALALVPAGLLVGFVGIPALGAAARAYGWFAQQLLGSNADPELTAEVTELRDARARVIAAADTERRRLERDLHDGAQQRLVSLALTLRMAEQRAEEGDPDAPELVRQAREEVTMALDELRDLARGIHPAILTNRGLAAALNDLAGRAAVPVEVTDAPGERLPEPVEAAAYFVVSECLANIGKHAQASRATVAVTARDGVLLVDVADDGRGGAGLSGGSGLQGLQDRVGAIDGRLTLDSPPGGGTRVQARLPLDGRAPEEEETVVLGGEPLSDEAAAALMARRRRLLRIRLSVLAFVAAPLVIIWALTGADYFWPVWPLIGLGLIGALDAWITLASKPLRESELPAPSAARTEALKERRVTRAVTLAGGVLLALDACTIAIWLASGAGYFWPVWPLFGTVVLAVPAVALVRRASAG
jgi:signal transduction histidine kinase